ncbi:HPr kinase/phosphorylase [Rhizobium sp. 0TCS1.26]|uniref:HPr kinase/phosphorylase n=1 Tax=Rhizobium sp. 0TCS1.26 TaxID=3142623 RepID=UPI003D2C9B61
MTPGANLHATVIVAGTRGLLFTGASGSGKSALAFACIAAARARGAFAALVADDQVFVRRHGSMVVAECPASIRGLIEIRGSGIATVASIDKARLDLAIEVIGDGDAERLPPEDERFSVVEGVSLPLIRLHGRARQPLAMITALRPEFHQERPFS